MPATLIVSSVEPVGAFIVSVPVDTPGKLFVSSGSPGRFPFAVQVTQVSSTEVRPLFYGYELNVKHQETEVQAGAGATTVGSGPVDAFVIDDDLVASVEVNGSEALDLVVAWAGLETGVDIHFRPSVAEGAVTFASEGVPATFVDLVNQTGGTFAYVGAGIFFGVQATVGGQGPTHGDLALANLRLILPTNAGQGELTFSGEQVSWSRTIGEDVVNTTCGDCHTVERHIGVLAGPWTSDLRYAGVAANFQAYLLTVDLPARFAPLASSALTPYPDCVTAFAGC